MAASGVDVNAPENSSKKDESQSNQPTPDGEKTTNGQITSRKRSRSGSRKPVVPRANEKGMYTIENETDKFRLLSFHERDDDFEYALNHQLRWQRELIDSKIRELTFLRENVSRMRQENPASIYGPGFSGYGNGTTNVLPAPGRAGMVLLYPSHRKRAGNRKAAPQPHIPRTDMTAQADLSEELVPIRLDIEHDKIKLRDTFTWNLHDHLTHPETFAQALVEDFRVPQDSVAFITHQIIGKMRQQLDNYYPHVFITDGSLDETLPYHAYKNDEMRITVKLNITIGAHTLVDQFEWEINNPLNNPEEFARNMTRDLSLSGEFTTAIAHQIREQSQMFTKSLYITSHPFDGRPIEDADVRDNFLPSPMHSVFRPFQMAKDFTPYLYELNDADLQREELSILRDQRRQKRSVTRRGGPALPDLKDRERTIRSLIVSSVLPGAAEVLETARLFKYSRTSGRGRRPGARADGGEESEESESEDSEVEVEQTPQIVATKSGRIVRGAASAAQMAMKANINPRSATPEVSQVQQHEPRSVQRRPPVEQPREETPEETLSLIVKLRLPKEIFRQWLSNPRSRLDRIRTESIAAASPRSARTSQTPAISTNKLASASPALSTNSKSKSKHPQLTYTYDENGRVDVLGPLKSGQEPPEIPDWLQQEISSVRQKYPLDAFEAFMKFTALDNKTGQVVRLDQIPSDKKPDNVKYQYQPRIKCLDCPGKFYNTGNGQTLENFEIHLRNRKHKDMVDQRRKTER